MAYQNSLDCNVVTRLGVPNIRKPQIRPDLQLPVDTVIVSPDTHLSIDQDIFYERSPKHLKDRVPRVWRDSSGACQVGWNSKGLGKMHSAVFASCDVFPGATNVKARVKDMRREGVEKEIAFPNSLLLAMFHPDLETRDYVFRTYNEYLAELQEQAPGQFYGVGLINHWDMKKSAESVSELKSLGLKTFMLPVNSGVDGEGNAIFYHADEITPMWEAIEESGLPVCFHVGESVSEGPRNSAAISALINFGPFRRTCGELIFGGILDRHPKLQIVFAEAGINWVPGMIQDAELIYSSYEFLHDWKLKKDIPSYWVDHMHATFMTDSYGLKNLDLIGADKVMWSSDYPHPESTWGYNWTAMAEVIKATSPDDARKVLGGNAIRVFDL